MRKCTRAIRQARERGLATRLFLAVTALIVLGACSTAQGAELPPLGPTGATGPTGAAGPTGPTGPANETLPSKGSETGVFAAKIHVPAGSSQDQAEGVISFSPKLKAGENPTAVYKTEAESKEPKAPCEGSLEKPTANEGTLCVYTGGGFGAKESEQKDAKFVGFISPAGEVCEGGKGTCKSLSEGGTMVLYRTNGFENAEGRGPALTEEAYLNVIGSWAVTSK